MQPEREMKLAIAETSKFARKRIRSGLLVPDIKRATVISPRINMCAHGRPCEECVKRGRFPPGLLHLEWRRAPRRRSDIGADRRLSRYVILQVKPDNWLHEYNYNFRKWMNRKNPVLNNQFPAASACLFYVKSAEPITKGLPLLNPRD